MITYLQIKKITIFTITIALLIKTIHTAIIIVQIQAIKNINLKNINIYKINFIKIIMNLKKI